MALNFIVKNTVQPFTRIMHIWRILMTSDFHKSGGIPDWTNDIGRVKRIEGVSGSTHLRGKSRVSIRN